MLGVNIIGLSDFSLGIGEDARMAKHTLDYLNIPTKTIGAPISCNSHKLTDTSANTTNPNNYSIDLFCLPPTDMIRICLEGGKDLLNRKSYKIGAWPWELPYWPVYFEKIVNFSDEIWAQSEYVFNCFSRLKNTTVYKMPMVVEIGTPKLINKEYIVSNKDCFIFYTMFDGNSSLSRKNPLASIMAFKLAFKNKKNANVSLVIKAMNTNSDEVIWRKIKEIANNDSRISIVDRHLNKDSLINLMASFDAFISLHRSEGFGRVIAEAMLLGQPVITSNFSGNIDFCNKDTCYLVDGHLVDVGINEYPLSDGQYWFEPDIYIASKQILNAYENTSENLRLTHNAKEYILKNYSIQSAANFYKKRLSIIAKKLQ
jgi:glycosyltransferase involved in cell wall biosynthesis